MARRRANIERNNAVLASLGLNTAPIDNRRGPRAPNLTAYRHQPSNASPARTRTGVAADIHEMMSELVSYDNRHAL